DRGVAHWLVVGGRDAIAGVPGSEGAGVAEKLVEARYGPHDLGELHGEPGLLLGQVGGEQRAQRRVPAEQLLVEPGRHDRQLRAEPLERRLHQAYLLRRHVALPSASARSARLLTPSLV